MKFLLVLTAILGLSCALPQIKINLPHRELKNPIPRGLPEDFLRLFEVLPWDDLLEVSQRYLDTDAEIQQVVAYLQGDDWHALVAEIASHPTWVEFKDYLTGAGVPIDLVIAFIHDAIENAAPSGKGTSRGAREYVDEVKELIPEDELLAVLEDLLANSESFQEFYGVISSDESRAFLKDVLALEEVQHIFDQLTQWGIDVDAIIEWVMGFLGWE